MHTKKVRYIPEGYTEYKPDIGDYKKDLFAAYVNFDKVSAIFYTGKQSNHTWYNRFNTVEDMKKKINTSISSLMSWEDRKEARKAERLAPHTLAIGDILSSSWGYEQTNVDFYQVIALKGEHTVELRKIASRIDHSSEGGCDYVIAVKDAFLTSSNEWDDRGKVLTKRAKGDSVSISSYQHASKWDGKAKYETALGWGH